MADDRSLVLQRQRKLKWRALDWLESLLMMLCGATLIAFCTSVVCDVVTRTIGAPWLWLQEVTSTFFIYGIFIGAAVATRRNDHLFLAAVGDSFTGRPRLLIETLIRLVVISVRGLPTYYGYINFLRGFSSFRMPSMTPIASLYAAIPLSGALITLFAIEQLVNGWRNGFEGTAEDDQPPPRECRRHEFGHRAPHYDVAVPVLRLSRRAGGVFTDRRGDGGRRLHRRHLRRNRAEDVRRRRFRGATRHSVLPAGRRAHELGQRGAAGDQPVAHPGRPHEGRPQPGGRGVQHVLFRRCRTPPTPP